MSEETKSGMQCAEFDLLLSEALDGVLGGAEREKFEAHRKACPNCGPMFAEAQRGMHLLRALPEVAPPVHFVHNVLAATTGQEKAAAAAVRPRETWWKKFRGSMQPVLAPVLQPKFAMSFAMAFFSISLVLNLAGVKVGNLRHLDLSPNAIVRGAYEAQGRVIKYYENIRFVYEIESRVQELKRATEPQESNPPVEKRRKDNSGNPDHKQNQNYSREQESVRLARLFITTPAAQWFAGSPRVAEPHHTSPVDQVFARRNS